MLALAVAQVVPEGGLAPDRVAWLREQLIAFKVREDISERLYGPFPEGSFYRSVHPSLVSELAFSLWQ